MGESKQAAAPTLPPHVSIYTGPGDAENQRLLNGKLFTRLRTTAATPKDLTAALKPSSLKSFCHQANTTVLIFDDDDQDAHHEHFREVCLLLKDADIGVQYARCVFDAESSLLAGFQLDYIESTKSVLVVDLQKIQEDKEEEEEDDDSDSDIDLEALGEKFEGGVS